MKNFFRNLIYPGLDLHTRDRASLCRYWKTGPRDVLDAGSGNGYFSWLAYQSGARVVGLNFNQAQVEKAREFLLHYRGADPARLHFEQGNLYNLSSESRTFDEIICYEVIEHLRRDSEVLAQFWRILRPGGVLHLCSPCRLHRHHQAMELDLEEAGGHVRAGYTEEDYRRLLEPIGFKIEKVIGLGNETVHLADKWMRTIRLRVGDFAALPLLPLGLAALATSRPNPPVPFSIYVKAVKPAAPTSTFIAGTSRPAPPTGKVYCYPKLKRFGLGNCMLVWARAFVCARRHGYQMLAPQWAQLRMGAIYRREAVTRFYLNDFTNDGYVRGLRKWWLLGTAERIPESAWIGSTDALAAFSHPRIIEFEEVADYFAPLLSDRKAIYSELKRIANPPALAASESMPQPFIAIHIRRGDTTRQKKIPLAQLAQYTPDEWYIAALRALRASPRWKDMPVKIISDGSPEELRAIVSKANCEVFTTGKAIGDILLMARSSLLLASGFSTFSMWSSFIGEMPTLYAPGKLQQRLFAPGSPQFEGEWSEGQPLPESIR